VQFLINANNDVNPELMRRLAMMLK